MPKKIAERGRLRAEQAGEGDLLKREHLVAVLLRMQGEDFRFARSNGDVGLCAFPDHL